MPAPLDRTALQALYDLLAGLPEFRTQDRRWGLVEEALKGAPRAADVLGRLDLSDPPRTAAVSLVTRLERFGCLGERHALALVLETVRRGCDADLWPVLDPILTGLDAGCRPVPTAAILHLSDVHLGTSAQARDLASQLAQDLKGELGCERLDGLICSGDLTQRAAEDEFAAAVEFLARVAAEFALGPERIVLVPGNHDLAWDLARAAYDPGERVRWEAADAGERRRWIVAGTDYQVRDEDRYRRRFDAFSTRCCQPVTGAPYPAEYPEQFSIHHWPDLDLLVLGLNSAWELDHHHRDRAGLHPGAVTAALDRLRARPDWAGCLKLAVWHHPLTSAEPSRIIDQGPIERLAQAGFRLALHGHIHRADSGLFRYDQAPGGRRLDLIAAGTSGAPCHAWVPGYPLQYNLLRLSAPGLARRLSVETRRREEPNGAWKPDARWLQGPGQDPLPRYGIDL